MNAIVAVDKNYGIGYKGNLLISIPSDMSFFKEMTYKKVVIMGRKTLASFKDGKPLKNRTNIVLSSSLPETENLIVCRNLEELKTELKKYNTDDVFVIGGARVYEELLPLCEKVYLTKIYSSFQCDTWFPNLDRDPSWILAEGSEIHAWKDIPYQFCTYVKTKEESRNAEK